MCTQNTKVPLGQTLKALGTLQITQHPAWVAIRATPVSPPKPSGNLDFVPHCILKR